MTLDYEEWLKKATSAIDTKVQIGRMFEVKHLFPGHEWEALSKGERINFGKHFSDAVKEGRLSSVKRCEEGKSHHNQYIKEN